MAATFFYLGFALPSAAMARSHRKVEEKLISAIIEGKVVVSLAIGGVEGNLPLSVDLCWHEHCISNRRQLPFILQLGKVKLAR